MQSIRLSPSKQNHTPERLRACDHDWNQTERSTFVSVLCLTEREAPSCDSIKENQGCHSLYTNLRSVVYFKCDNFVAKVWM